MCGEQESRQRAEQQRHDSITMASLARSLELLRVHHPEMSGESIVTRECLLLSAVWTPDLHLAVVVDGILMSGEVIGP